MSKMTGQRSNIWCPLCCYHFFGLVGRYALHIFHVQHVIACVETLDLSGTECVFKATSTEVAQLIIQNGTDNTHSTRPPNVVLLNSPAKCCPTQLARRMFCCLFSYIYNCLVLNINL